MQAQLDKRPEGKKPVKPAGPLQMTVVIEALGAAQGPIEGCFKEWAERNQGTHDEVPEATLVVGLTVTADGVGTMAKILRTPDKHPVMPADGVPGRSILEMCASEQIARVPFPTGPEQLEIEATAHWSSTGEVNLSSRVIGHHPVPNRQIELP